MQEGDCLRERGPAEVKELASAGVGPEGARWAAALKTGRVSSERRRSEPRRAGPSQEREGKVDRVKSRKEASDVLGGRGEEGWHLGEFYLLYTFLIWGAKI